MYLLRSFKEGVVYLRQMLQIDSERPAILAALADALLEIGELAEAEAVAKRSLVLDAAASAPYATLADIHSVRGEADLMVAAIETGAGKTGSIQLLGKLAFQCGAYAIGKMARRMEPLSAALPDSGGSGDPFFAAL